MEDENTKSEVEFTDFDRLNLQQLLIRRALVAYDQKKSCRKDDESLQPEAGMLGESEPWQLLPRNVKLHEWQKNCLEIWLGNNGRGTVKVATGGGKTMFALAAAQKLQNTSVTDLRMAIVVPTIPLMNQWRDELGSSNLHASQIGLLGGGNQFEESDNLRIIISVINSAREKLPGIIESLSWGEKLLLVVDECHRSNAKEAQKIFNTKPMFTLGLSATPEVNSSDEGQPVETDGNDFAGQSNMLSDTDYGQSAVGKALGGIIFDFSLKDCMEAGLLTKFDVYHVGLTLNEAELAEYTKISREISELRKDLQARHRKSGSKQNLIAWCQSLATKEGEGDAARFIGLANQRKRLLYSASNRMVFTLLILQAVSAESEMQKDDSKAIVFHESIPDINAIYREAEKRNLPVVLEHSELPQSIRTESIELFRHGTALTVVSARSLVEGFNVPSADIGIIAASSSSVRQRIQSLGRMLRIGSSKENAKIFVLYVMDTEDEAIYEKADWASVLGSERNSYYRWVNSETEIEPPTNVGDVIGLLEEVSVPPRMFRPSCREIDVGKLTKGGSYPAQTVGTQIRVDDSLNPKTDDGMLVGIPQEFVEEIVKKNKFRRAAITPCGHLICRDSEKEGSDDCWIYLGNATLPANPVTANKVKYKVTQNRGKRVIGKPVKGGMNFASGESLEGIMQWLISKEVELGGKVKNLYWDGKSEYWIENKGERIICDRTIGELEFQNL